MRQRVPIYTGLLTACFAVSVLCTAVQAQPMAGLQFHLDASDVDGDGDPSNNPAPGTTVDVWTDKSAGVVLEQADAAAQPVMSTLRGQPAVDFTDDEYLVGFDLSGAAFLDDTAGSMVSILSGRNSAQSFYFELARDNGGCDWVIDMPDCAAHESTLLPWIESAGFGAQGIGEIPPGSDANIANISDVAVATDDSLQYSIWSGGTGINWNFATNGLPPADGRNLATPSRETWWAHVQNPGGPKYVSLGGGRTRSSGVVRGNKYSGHIAEILIVDHPLSAKEHAAVDDYVQDKYFDIPQPPMNLIAAPVGPDVQLDWGKDPGPFASLFDNVAAIGNCAGTPAMSASYDAADASYTLTALGGDVWNNGDNMTYMYREVAGDFDLRVNFPQDEVVTADGVDWAKSGPMARESADSDRSRFVFPHTSQPVPHDSQHTRRAEEGSAIANVPDWAPVTGERFEWLGLSRTGSLITTRGSLDGVDWVDKSTYEWGTGPLLVGLAQGGNGAGAGAEFCEIDPPTTVTFRNVTFTEDVAPAVEGRFFDQSAFIIGGPGIDCPEDNVISYDTGTEEYFLSHQGGDTWTEGDTLAYAYTEITGDFDVNVRILSETAGANWSKAGLMLRQTTDFDSKHSWVVNRNNPGPANHYTVWGGRSDHGVAGTAFNTESNLDPVYSWLRMERIGSVATGYGSDDGVNWNQIGTTDWGTMPDTVLVGLTNVGNTPGACGNAMTATYAQSPPKGAFSTTVVIGSEACLADNFCDFDVATGEYDIQAMGGDVWNGGDSFVYTATQRTGDFVLDARITSLTSAQEWGKAALMVRQSLDPLSKFSWIHERSSESNIGTPNDTYWGGRPTHEVDGGLFNTRDPSGAADGTLERYEYVRIARCLNNVTGYGSHTGEAGSYVQLADFAGSPDQSTTSWGPDMPDTVWVGLAVASLATDPCDQVINATFDNVSFLDQPSAQLLCAPDSKGIFSRPTAFVVSGSGVDCPTTRGAEYFPETGEYALTGAGGDVWQQGDTFSFCYNRMLGNFAIEAHIVSEASSVNWGKSGLMVRQNTTDTSRHSWNVNKLDPGGPTDSVWGGRTEHGTANTAFNDFQSGRAPYPWLRMERSGNVVTGFGSGDGVSWDVVGSTDWGADMPPDVTAGLTAVGNSTDCNNTVDVVYDNVSMQATGVFTDTAFLSGSGDICLDSYANVREATAQEAGDGAAEFVYDLGSQGGDVWDGGDTMTYMYSEMEGDFILQGHVVNTENPVDWGKTGLMLRQNLDTDSRHSWMMNKVDAGGPTNSVWGGRTAHNVVNSVFNTIGDAPPLFSWLKIVRKGNIMKGFGSDDGSNWNQLGESDWGDAPDTILAGINVVGNSTNCAVGLGTGVLDNVSITPLGAFDDAATTVAEVDCGAEFAYDASTGTYNIGSQGGDVWGAGDTMAFMYANVTGNFAMQAHVVSHDAKANWGKAALMARQEPGNPVSRHSWVHERINPQDNEFAHGEGPDNYTNWGGRTVHGEAGAIFNNQTADNGHFEWLRLERSGSVLSGFGSDTGEPGSWQRVDGPNGEGFTDWGGDIPNILAVGLVVVGNTTACAAGFTTVTFDNVSFELPDPFVRGDINSDGSKDIADPVYNAASLFLGGPAPRCLESADTNADGERNLADVIYQLNALFTGGPAVPSPASCEEGGGFGIDCEVSSCL